MLLAAMYPRVGAIFQPLLTPPKPMGSPSSNAICLTVCALLNHVSICLARSLQHYLIHNFQLKKIVLAPLKIDTVAGRFHEQDGRCRWKWSWSRERCRHPNKMEAEKSESKYASKWCCEKFEARTSWKLGVVQELLQASCKNSKRQSSSRNKRSCSKQSCSKKSGPASIKQASCKNCKNFKLQWHSAGAFDHHSNLLSLSIAFKHITKIAMCRRLIQHPWTHPPNSVYYTLAILFWW